MRVRTLTVLAAALLAVTACTSAATPAPTPSPTPAATAAPSVQPTATAVPKAADLVIPKPAGNLTVKIGIPSTTSLSTVPLSMTVDRLKAQGWTTSLVEFTGSALNTQALGQGDVQFSQGQVLDAVRALQKGGPIGWLAENNGGEFVIMAKSTITSCADLNGKRLGFQGAAAPVTVVTTNWLKGCNATAQVVVITGGENRAVAMEKDQLDAATAQMADWLALKARSGSQFRLVDTGTTFDISGAHIWANKTWADANPEIAAAFTAEILKTFRMIREDKALFKAELLKYVPGTPANLADQLIDAYIETVKAWPADGGNTAKVATALDFYTKSGDLTAGTTADGLVLTAVRTKALQLAGQAK